MGKEAKEPQEKEKRNERESKRGRAYELLLIMYCIVNTWTKEGRGTTGIQPRVKYSKSILGARLDDRASIRDDVK